MAPKRPERLVLARFRCEICRKRADHHRLQPLSTPEAGGESLEGRQHLLLRRGAAVGRLGGPRRLRCARPGGAHGALQLRAARVGRVRHSQLFSCIARSCFAAMS